MVRANTGIDARDRTHVVSCAIVPCAINRRRFSNRLWRIHSDPLTQRLSAYIVSAGNKMHCSAKRLEWALFVQTSRAHLARLVELLCISYRYYQEFVHRPGREPAEAHPTWESIPSQVTRT